MPGRVCLDCLPPAWAGSESFFASSDVGRDLAAIVHVDLRTGAAAVVIDIAC